MGAREAFVSGGGAYSYTQWTGTGTGHAGNGCGAAIRWTFTIDNRCNYLIASGSEEGGSWSSMTHDSGAASYTKLVNGGYNTHFWGYANPTRGSSPVEQTNGSSLGCWLAGGIQLANVDTTDPVVASSTSPTSQKWFTITTVPNGIALATASSRNSGYSLAYGTELWDRGCWTSSPCGVGRGIAMAYKDADGATSVNIGWSGGGGLSAATSAISMRGRSGSGGAVVIMFKESRLDKMLDALSDKYRRLLDEMILDPLVAWHNPAMFPKNYKEKNRHYDEYRNTWDRALWEWELSR